MKTIKLEQLEQINGGTLLGGVCHGMALGTGLVSLAAAASSFGWIAVIPGIGQAAAIGAIATVGVCAVYNISND